MNRYTGPPNARVSLATAATIGWNPLARLPAMTAAQFLIDTSALGRHRGAGPVDLVLAATAELSGLTLLHHDRDFATIATVTGQSLRWYGTD